MDTILSTITVSVTELKRNFAGILRQADDCPVAVLNHNRLRPTCCRLPTTKG